ncbi:MAG: multidrug effflux MFS transporter [Gammaproteobacteria bacterium]|nr:multidrug effflux MFS transporter [Gammaproteobacteria bacterium]
MSAHPTNPISPVMVTFLVAGLVAIMPFAIDAYLPAMAAMASDLGTSVHYLEQSISSFYLGIALGQLVGAPFSDRHGRRPPIMIGLIIFIAASIAITQATSSGSLIAWRFVQALGAGVASVNAATIVRDMFDEIGTARLFANIAVVMMVAPLFSPLIGAGLLSLFGWPAIFMFLASYAFAIMITLYIWLPETRYLRRKPVDKNGYRHVFASVWSNVLAVSLACSSVCFFLYLADSAFIFLEFYGFSPSGFAWLFATGVVMLIAAHQINRWLLKFVRPRRILLYAMPLQTAVSFLLLFACLMSAPSVWLIYPLIMVLASITQVINSNGMAIYLSLHPDHAGKANAVLGSMRFGMGGLFGFALVYLHSAHPITFAALSVIATVMALTLFLACRSRSDLFARHHML